MSLFLAQVADYHELPRPAVATQVRCLDAKRRVQSFVGEYYGFVNRHQIDNGGKLTYEEAIAYRGEADRYVRSAVAEIDRLRFTNVDPSVCDEIADDAIDGMGQNIIARRFGPSYGYTMRSDGRWRKRGR